MILSPPFPRVPSAVTRRSAAPAALRNLRLALALVIGAAGPSQATCLALNPYNTGGWINYCGVWISVLWNDQRYCASTGNSVYPCAANVPPNGSSADHTFGTVNWHECQSPGGPNDVLAIEREYGAVYCVD